MNYNKFLELVNEEIEFLIPFDLASDEHLSKGMGACLVLREYIQKQIEMETQL